MVREGWTPEFLGLVRSYQNETNWYIRNYAELDAKVTQTDWLNAHREWIVSHFWGMGDRAHWWVWKMLVEQMPESFRFLEIGVYYGSILSLISLISRKTNRHVDILGVTPLKPTSDHNFTYTEPEMGFAHNIAMSFNILAPGGPMPYLFMGMSQETLTITRAKKWSPYDILYIDGGHVYANVVSDIHHYCSMVRPGGFVVVDDASVFLNVPRTNSPGGWKGHDEVSSAIRDTLENDSKWTHLFAVSHNRVFYHGPRSDFGL